MINPALTEIDIVILSYARSEELKNITENCIDSLIKSENPSRIKFNIIVVESNKSMRPYQYENAKTVYPWQSFGYHKYMNIGIKMTKSKYVCICNNDLLFHPNWATEILSAFKNDKALYSVSPACTIHHPQQGIEINSGIHYGYEVRKELIGWCIFFRRDMLKITGKLDPGFKFWYADNDYSNTLQKHNLKHALITSSHVDHLESRTLKTENENEQKKLTAGERFYYEYKWEGRSFFSYLNKLRKFRKNLRRGRI
ncbi:glycosyltransferase [Dyadobacter sp. LHD-138]|uniref:glycosyltransferase family 2 protein n=1 Tax=Dyadobacter sp. LHD-138 TaxID=3071413 RepID=UPI0027E1B90C|nr:glycosyltransferase [Dyadobacter sp. LHD-138]MDQ6481815.1 glycosyltransferase [Dyadobacter sp. LHD-138]